jgi:molybdopterin molybdotransferase
MNEWHQAVAIVLGRTGVLPAETLPLSPATVSLGRVLAEPAISDLDSPPFDKALMDGFAVRSADCGQPGATLRILEEVMAGQTPTKDLHSGDATRIMTGAMLPVGADAVVPVEKTTLDGDRVTLTKSIRPEEHILRRGREMTRGETILPAGTRLGPQEFGILSTIGFTRISAVRAPRVAILPTGDELVEPSHSPGPGQIRNSNGPMLEAQVTRAGGIPQYRGIAPDRIDRLKTMIADALESCDVLILSGGVSAGKLDLVPGILEELGVETHFHKVNLKPGRPLLFGTRGDRLIFGLPGNPVSSFVCFELVIRPAICKLSGHRDPGPTFIPISLAKNFSTDNNRPTFGPGKIQSTPEGLRLDPIDWFGSADLRALAGADALWSVAAGRHDLRAGELVPVLMME